VTERAVSRLEAAHAELTVEGKPERRPDWELFPELSAVWPLDGFGPVATVAAQLPDPHELAAGSLVVVHETGRRVRGLRRLLAFWKRKPRAHAAVRCTALLARGYLEIGAALDARSGERLVWGFAPEAATPTPAATAEIS
jgi:hypothetical protein